MMLMWPGGDPPGNQSSGDPKQLQNSWMTVPMKKKKKNKAGSKKEKKSVQKFLKKVFESSNSTSSDEDYDPAEQANMFQMVKLGAMGRSRYERLVARQDPATWSKNKDTAKQDNASWRQWRESTNWKWGSDKKEKEKTKRSRRKSLPLLPPTIGCLEE